MSTPQQQTEQKPKATGGERVPIRVARLIVTHANPNGVRLPIPGLRTGGREHMGNTLDAGPQGEDFRIEIDYRPWLHCFRILRFAKDKEQKSGGDIAWKMTHEFYMPREWAIWSPAEPT